MEQASSPLSILVVEDDVNLGYLLRENLHDKGFKTTIALNGKEGVTALVGQHFDLCILDVMLPEEDGFSVAAHIRKHAPRTPFLFVTARTQEADRLHGFELGAEDYILKPFSFKELHYRLQVILRRNQAAEPPVEKSEVIRFGNMHFDAAERVIRIMDKVRRLSQRETDLLSILLQSKGSFVARSKILTQLWGRDDYFTARSMDVFLTRIRKLLKDDQDIEIENLYGSGYRIRLKTAD